MRMRRIDKHIEKVDKVIFIKVKKISQSEKIKEISESEKLNSLDCSNNVKLGPGEYSEGGWGASLSHSQ